MVNTKNTHALFFKGITINKLNELYHRADKRARILEQHLNSLLNDIRTGVILKDGGEYNCSIYIEYYKNNSRIGHLTIHFNKNEKNIQKLNGRIHVTNNRNKTRKYPILISPTSIQNQNTISLSLESHHQVRQELIPAFQTTIDILNLYFDPQSEYYLGNQMTIFSNTPHRCLSPVTEIFKHTTTPIRKTRKRHWINRNYQLLRSLK
jgi:hypothetical protein